MKKILLVILLLSCNKTIENINFKNKDINEDLVLAIINKDTSKAVELINKGANINYIYNNKSILELSLDKKNLDIVKMLLKKEVEIIKDNIVKIYNLALEEFNYKIIDLLEDKYKLDKNLVSKNKYFLFLCYTGNLEKFGKFITKNKSGPILGYEINGDALVAAAGNRIEVFKILIKQYGINIDFKNGKGLNSLMIALIRNKKEIIEFTIRKGINVNDKSNNGKTALMIASKKGQERAIKLLLEKGANINDKSNNGTTALILACKKGKKRIVELLIEKGANINDNNKQGWTALMVACNNDYKEITELLIEKGANINEKNDIGHTALMAACQNGHEEVVKLLLERGANVNDKSNKDVTSLILASKNGHKEIVALLMENDANVKDRSKKGSTSLMLACQSGHKEVAKLLIEKGANINDKKSKKVTSLMLACQSGHKEVAKLLLENGANIKCRSKGGWTSLILACQNGHEEVVKLLLERGANINDRSNKGITSLMLASKNCHREVVRLLLEKGSNVNDKSNKGITSLMLASKKGYEEVVRLLLEKGANVNDKSNSGSTSLILASHNGYQEVVKLLLERGVDINAKDRYSCTSLMIACHNGHKEIVRLLLESGADMNIKDIYNNTAAIEAVLAGNQEIVELLLRNDLNINEKNNDGMTLLMLACHKRHKEVVDLLLEKGANIDKGTNSKLKNKRFNALKIAHDKDDREIIELLVSKGANVAGFKDISLEEVLIKNMKNKNINNCLIMINAYKNRINYNYISEGNNGLLHHAALTNDTRLFQELLKKGCSINFQNNRYETPLLTALGQERIDDKFIIFLIDKGATLNFNLKYNEEIWNVLFNHQNIFDRLILSPFIKQLLGNKILNDENKNILKDIIYILKLREEDFCNEKEMLDYIKNIFIIKSSNIILSIEDIESIQVEKEVLVDFELEADYILGAAFDLGQDEYYGDTSLESIRESFKDKLLKIVETKAPKFIPSINANDKEKSDYVKYLTKKRLRILSLRLSDIPNEKRKDKLGWIMNQILANLSCPTGTLEAINYAVNCLIGIKNEFGLKEIIEKELMLYRISLLEEVARKHLDNICISIMLDESGRELARDKGVYSEHMKAYLIMDLYEELKITGSYEKDFKYIYNRALVIKEVKKLYKERALNYIIDHIINTKNLSNKVRDYLEENIFKNRKLEGGEKPTVFHIESFVYDENLTKLNKEALKALLIHFKLLK